MDILHRPDPMISWESAKLRKFGEANIPKKARGRTADLDRLESSINPDQLAINATPDKISREQGPPAVYAVSYI